MAYFYAPRPPVSTRAKIPAHAIFTGLTIQNIRSQYKRKKLSVIGPRPMIQNLSSPNGYEDGTIWPWPWICPVRSDGDHSEYYVGDVLDNQVFTPKHKKGKITVQAVIVGTHYLGNNPDESIIPEVSALEDFSIVEVDLSLKIERVNVGATSTKPQFIQVSHLPQPTQPIRCYPSTPFYAGSTIHQQLYFQDGTSSRYMIHPPDMKLCQPSENDHLTFNIVTITIPYDLDDWGVSLDDLSGTPLVMSLIARIPDGGQIHFYSEKLLEDPYLAAFCVPYALKVFCSQVFYYDEGVI